MALYYRNTKLLTAKALRCDYVANDVGYWRIQTELRGKPIEFTIVRNKPDGYSLAIVEPFELIGTVDTLEDVAQVYNNYIGQAYVPESVLKRADVYLLVS